MVKVTGLRGGRAFHCKLVYIDTLAPHVFRRAEHAESDGKEKHFAVSYQHERSQLLSRIAFLIVARWHSYYVYFAM